MTEIKTNLQYDIQRYILNQGTIADKFRILSAGYSIPSEITDGLIDELQSIVNSDGGLPFELQKGNPSSVKVTAELLTLLFSKISGVDTIVESMITFLISRQKKDGGFAEALNLSNERSFEFSIFKERLIELKDTGRRYSIGARMVF